MNGKVGKVSRRFNRVILLGVSDLKPTLMCLIND